MFLRRVPAETTILLQTLLILAATTSQVLPAAPAPAASTAAGEITPLKVIQPGGITRQPRGLFSNRTLRVAIEVDREGARLIHYTLKDIPFIRPLEAQGTDLGRTSPRVEVALLGPDGKRYTRGFEVSLCFEHAGDSEPHVMGDTIQLHRDIFVIELPEIAGFDRIGISAYAARAAGGTRMVQVTEALDDRRFTRAGGKARYRDLVFAIASQEGLSAQPSPDAPQPSGVIWPEDIGDPEMYRVEGRESEGERRINVVVVPDAYRPGDKDLMISQFLGVSRYMLVSPFVEHASLINYVLVFAYSIDNAPDQCDCDIVMNTAMGTNFGDLKAPYDGCLGHSCLFYDRGCDHAK